MSAPVLRPAQEVYPSARTEFGCFDAPGYSDLLAEFGPVVLQVDQDDYQGDSWVLYRDGDRWGFLTFGWGSCSGCDALEACADYEDLDKLRHELRDGIRWGTAAEVRAFIGGAAEAGRYYSGLPDFERFQQQATDILDTAEAPARLAEAFWGLSLALDWRCWDEDVARVVADAAGRDSLLELVAHKHHVELALAEGRSGAVEAFFGAHGELWCATTWTADGEVTEHVVRPTREQETA